MPVGIIVIIALFAVATLTFVLLCLRAPAEHEIVPAGAWSEPHRPDECADESCICHTVGGRAAKGAVQRPAVPDR